MTERPVMPSEHKPAESLGQRSQKAPKPPRPRKVERRRKGRNG